MLKKKYSWLILVKSSKNYDKVKQVNIVPLFLPEWDKFLACPTKKRAMEIGRNLPIEFMGTKRTTKETVDFDEYVGKDKIVSIKR